MYYWEVSHTGGKLYDPETHEIKPRKEFIKKEVIRIDEQIDALKDAEIAYIKRVAEITKSLKEEIKELEKKLEE